MAHPLFNLDGKIALVTGASRGIGESISNLFAEHGATVIVSSRKIDGCQTVADRITRAGHKADVIPCHIGNMEDIHSMMSDIREKYGRLDILVNNAAANPYFGHVLDTDPGAFQKTLDVNIRGYFFISIKAAKLMRENGGGSIINTSSVNGLTPGDMQGIYSITKAAVINMTKVFARECAEFGIRCNALLPGLTRTKFAGALFETEGFYDEVVAGIPMKRHAEPSEMAGAALFLASDASSYMTGQNIVIDGGLTA
ncbi:MAG: SDR family oxidoreductase [Roseovarius sp.]|nr:SDR family oxidoreductase [Roseovarius sp.]MCY4207461.1 SDR family oxidoreductase [Roseovarius sp.]MCY4290807.1 SDR family oxidoreductase [Roseovarius sp.]MCY4315325.1 SDR family oxidoreductase [Roseovarius sp.]